MILHSAGISPTAIALLAVTNQLPFSVYANIEAQYQRILVNRLRLQMCAHIAGELIIQET